MVAPVTPLPVFDPSYDIWVAHETLKYALMSFGALENNRDELVEIRDMLNDALEEDNE